MWKRASKQAIGSRKQRREGGKGFRNPYSALRSGNNSPHGSLVGHFARDRYSREPRQDSDAPRQESYNAGPGCGRHQGGGKREMASQPSQASCGHKTTKARNQKTRQRRTTEEAAEAHRLVTGEARHIPLGNK